MTLSTMLADLYRKLNYASSPASDVTTRLTAFLNEINHRLLGLPGMDALRQSRCTFASVASTPEYSLASDIERILSIRDASNQIVLRGEPFGWYSQQTASPTATTGLPESWVLIGQAAVDVQPSNASKVYVDSTSASDIGNCYVEGVRTGGYAFATTTVMTGTTAVQIGAWTDIVQITKFYLSAAAVGSVTLHEDAEGGTQLALIPAGATHARYLRIALWPTPSAAVTYTVDYLRHLEEMANPYDEPVIPRDFHWVLEAGARMLEYEKTDDRRYPAARADYEKGTRDLKWFVTQQADGRSTMSGMAVQGSRLGAWYPRGT